MTERELFAQALEIPDARERAAFLEQACGEDAGLRGRIERLLAERDKLGSYLEAPAVAALTIADSSNARPGLRVGRYRLLEQIGEGGMGTVWVAEQTEPVRRRVALKLIKPGMDSRQVLSRFEAERQALALMDHPNIAKVHDGGMTDEGRPYFVMEYVKGVPITEFCDNARLSIQERLKLFVQVCQAVQHAHQKGVIHRDLKPSNILVCLYDGVAVPKVIDFGLAKAIHQPLTEHTLYTAHGLMVGTPLYMSPEQAELNNFDIDTRSDIYSLGVILYELLTGTTPLEKQQFNQAAFQEILRLIKEFEPPKPSAKISSSVSLPNIAAQRSLEPAQLSRLVRGDLDWIVMKSLEKERSRRYETASDLARDIERHLHDEPVEAGPPSAAYRLKKLARKHRTALSTAATFVGLLAVGTSVSTWQAIRATRAEAVARVSERKARLAEDAEREAKNSALEREAETNAVLFFVDKTIFAPALPKTHGGLGPQVLLVDAVKRAVPFVEKFFRDQPLIEARLRTTMSAWFLDLGEPQVAADQIEAAHAIYAKYRGTHDLGSLQTMSQLAVAYNILGRYVEGVNLLEVTLAQCKTTLGPAHFQTLSCMNDLANGYASLGRHEQVVKLLEESLSLKKASFGPAQTEDLESMNKMAESHAQLGRLEEAKRLRDETLALFEAKLGPADWGTLEAMSVLATSYAALGRHEQSLKLRNETLVLSKFMFLPDHPDIAMNMWGVAESLVKLDRGAEAMPILDECLKRAVGEFVDPRLIPSVFDVRLEFFAKAKDAAGCRETAETWEKLNRTDAASLYQAAQLRAVTAALVRINHQSQAAAKDANAEADRAMECLRKAVAAGYRNAAQLAQDKDLEALRGREDFQKLLAELRANMANGPK